MVRIGLCVLLPRFCRRVLSSSFQLLMLRLPSNQRWFSSLPTHYLQDSVDIAPLNDRMVLFSSMHLLHRVLPSAAERYCFTIWISAGGGSCWGFWAGHGKHRRWPACVNWVKPSELAPAGVLLVHDQDLGKWAFVAGDLSRQMNSLEARCCCTVWSSVGGLLVG